MTRPILLVLCGFAVLALLRPIYRLQVLRTETGYLVIRLNQYTGSVSYSGNISTMVDFPRGWKPLD